MKFPLKNLELPLITISGVYPGIYLFPILQTKFGFSWLSAFFLVILIGMIMGGIIGGLFALLRKKFPSWQ